MQSNPFAPHAPATTQTFVDRDREVDLIFGHVKALQRGNVAINGPLGIGKTSLLRYVAAAEVCRSYGASPPEVAVVYLDTQSVTPFSGDRFWRRVGQLLSRSPEVDLAGPVARLLAREVIDVIDVEEFLDTLGDQGTALVLLLDEFEWALQADNSEAAAESRNFLAQLASLARRTPRVLSLVVATEAALTEATRVIESWRGSPFPTIFTSVTLKPLGQVDADRLLELALQDQSVQFSESDRQRLYALSEGLPAALQAAAFSLYHGLRHGVDRERLWEAAELAAERARQAPLEGPEEPPLATRSPLNHDGTTLPSGLWIDAHTGEVLLDQQRVESLTALEYSLLRYLYANPGRLCSKEEIIRHVWGEEFMGEIDDSRVEKLVSRLRRKVESMPNRPQYIRTVRGRGYRFVP
jgi:hypothetical protein